MCPTISEPKQDRSRLTRERLLEAAVASLAESGWARTTVATVAAKAGVTRGAAQHHFPTRGDLVTAAIRYMSDVRLSELRSTVAAPPAGSNRTRWALDQIVGLYTGALFGAALHVWAEAAVDAELRAHVVPLERTPTIPASGTWWRAPSISPAASAWPMFSPMTRSGVRGYSMPGRTSLTWRWAAFRERHNVHKHPPSARTRA